MRIVDIRETAIPLKSQLANSSFDFTEMTSSVVAVITDVVRDGRPVVGFAFNSTGRYAMAKIRVGGLPLAEDLRRVEAALKVVGEGGRLAVDANCKFGRDEALGCARALAPVKLRWFEEPCDPLDFALMAELAGAYE